MTRALPKTRFSLEPGIGLGTPAPTPNLVTSKLPLIKFITLTEDPALTRVKFDAFVMVVIGYLNNYTPASP